MAIVKTQAFEKSRACNVLESLSDLPGEKPKTYLQILGVMPMGHIIINPRSLSKFFPNSTTITNNNPNASVVDQQVKQLLLR